MMYKLCSFAVLLLGALRAIHGSPPTWSGLSSTYSIDSTNDRACDRVTNIDAISTDTSDVDFSVISQTPNGGFTTEFNAGTASTELRCNISTIRTGTTTTYTLVLRAQHQSNREYVDATVTISVTGLNLNSPVFHGTPYEIKLPKGELESKYCIAGYGLANITVTDADTGQSVTVTGSGTTFGIGALSSTEFGITVSDQTACMQLTSPYEWVIVAVDNGSSPRRTSATVTVTIESDSAVRVASSAGVTLICVLLIQHMLL